MMPLFPAPEEISVDYSKFKENICFEKQPNVLVVRSELNPFIRLVGNTIFINPGKLTKGSLVLYSFSDDSFCRKRRWKLCNNPA
jgi:hypothetical protein